MILIDDIFREFLKSTKPTKEALEEARARRDLVFEAALTYEGAYKTVKSGSIAHGTANIPIEDADGSVVLNRKYYPSYGPDGDNIGPKDLVIGIAEDIRDIVKQVYPDVWISTSHKHAIYFRFRQEMPDGQDPTVDLVIALNRKEGDGLWIPHMTRNIWQASDPEKHAKLVAAKCKDTNYVSTKVVRLGKLYAKQYDPVLLFSFHVTALMLESLQSGTKVGDGFKGMLEHAASSLADGNTKDPAGVSAPLTIPDGRNREKLVRKLELAAEHVTKAIDLEADDDSNYDEIVSELEKVFWNDSLKQLLEDAALKVKLDRAIARANSKSTYSYAAPAAAVSAASVTRPTINARAYGDAAVVTPHYTLPRKCDWYSDLETRTWFEKGVIGSEYTLLYAGENDSTCSYIASVPVPGYKRRQLVRIVFKGKYPDVYTPGLTGLRHVYDRSSDTPHLCMWYPFDNPDRKWIFDKGLLALLDMIKTHLYKEMYFKETGHWPGEEVH
jgi:hypothetical protein